MKTVKRLVAAGVLATLTAWPLMAQVPVPAPDQTGRRGGFMFGRGPGANVTESVAAVATNVVVAKAIGLTKEQSAAIGVKLSAAKATVALAAQRLATDVATILTDPAVAADLGLTEAQVTAIRKAMTPELIKEAFSADEIERFARSVAAGAMAGTAVRAIQERMQQYDTNGDGQISDEERRAAMNAWRQRGGGGMQGGGQRSGQRGGAQQQRGGAVTQ